MAGTGKPDVWARLEAALLALLIVLGCQVLWLVVPVGTLWLMTRFIGDAAGLLIVGLIAMPVALGAAAWMLSAANRRYLRLPGRRGSRRGPLEVVVTPSIVLAIVTATVWFVFFANHMPTGREQLIP